MQYNSKNNYQFYTTVHILIILAFVLALIYFFLSYQSMATNSQNSPGHESVVIDNDEGINVKSNRTTIHIKSKVFTPKNNECVLIGNKSLI